MSDRSLTLGMNEALAPAGNEARVGDYVALLKPRVMSLVVFTGFAGILAAPGPLHPLLAAVAVLCIAVAAGGAGAINMWYDRDIDAVMRRTKSRPIPRGRVEAPEALSFGIVLSLFSVMVMGLALNWTAAALLALANGFYVFVYTVWLKRRTSQNIVIGGAAGAFPPMIGWAAVTGGLSLEPLLLFLIIFAWTPPHFWALALYRATDYAKAGVPMLPVVSGIRHTQVQILLYTVLLAAVAMAPSVIGMTGWLYGISAGVLNLLFLLCSWRLYRSDESALEKPAKQTFGFSILYLFALFAALIVDRAPTVGAIW